VRDALKRLEHDGLVSQGKRNSYLVNAFGPEDAAEIYAIRSLLEPHAAVLGLARLSDEGRERLHALFEEMTWAAGDAESYVALNTRFHMLLYEASGRPRLVRMIESLWAGRPQLTPLHVAGQLKASQEEHRGILRAIDAADAEALELLLREHIQRAGEGLARWLTQKES
jgi:DNA-binding GntR family transcriptional regulator